MRKASLYVCCALSLGVAACEAGTATPMEAGTATPTTVMDARRFRISGEVSGDLAQGVTISLSGSTTGTTTTAANGSFAFAHVADGSYTVTPSRTGYTFSPPSRTVSVSGANATGEDFTATVIPTWTLSGTVSGATAEGVTMTLSGAASRTTTTATDGTYAFTALQDGSYTVTPSKTGYTFDPVSQVVMVSGADVGGQSFTATAAATTFTISGTVSGDLAQGVTISLSGSATGTTTTAVDGTYAFTSIQNGSYTVTPSMTGCTFSPPSRTFSVSGANATGEDFTATVIPTWTLSGTVSGTTAQGVTMTLSGAASRTTTTAMDGTYAFTTLQDGSYTVTPSKNGYTFAPASRTLSVSGANATGEDFVASISTSTTPVVDPGFPICWTHSYSKGTFNHAFTFSTGGARQLVLTTSWYTSATDPYPVTATWTSGTPSGATAWTAQTWPGAPGAHDGSIHWTTYIFTASASSALSSSTVTVRSHASDWVAGISCLWSVSGASGFGAKVDHHSPMSDVSAQIFVPVQATLTATQSSSLIIGHATGGELIADYGLTVPLSALPNTTVVAQYVGDSDSGHVAFYMNAPTAAGQSYTVGLRQTGAGSGGSYTNTQLCRAYAVEAIEVLAQ